MYFCLFLWQMILQSSVSSKKISTKLNILKEACCSATHAQFTGMCEEQEANKLRLRRRCCCLLPSFCDCEWYWLRSALLSDWNASREPAVVKVAIWLTNCIFWDAFAVKSGVWVRGKGVFKSQVLERQTASSSLDASSVTLAFACRCTPSQSCVLVHNLLFIRRSG